MAIDKDTVSDRISKSTGGIGKRRLQSSLGIYDPMAQECNADVWRLSRVLVSLEHKKFITSIIENGERRYFPR